MELEANVPKSKPAWVVASRCSAIYLERDWLLVPGSPTVQNYIEQRALPISVYVFIAKSVLSTSDKAGYC